MENNKAGKDSLKKRLERYRTEFKSLIKKPYFITIIIILGILIGFLILLCTTSEQQPDNNNTEYRIIHNNIVIPIHNIGIDITVVQDNEIDFNAEISSSLLANLQNNPDIHVNQTYYTNTYDIEPIYIGNNYHNPIRIRANVIQSDEEIFKVKEKVLRNAISINIDREEGKITIDNRATGKTTKRSYGSIALYFICILLTAYLICIFKLKDIVTVTLNNADKYFIIIIGIALAILVLGSEADPNAFMDWMKYITITCIIITLTLTVIANLPNPLYALLGVLSKLFIIFAIALVTLIIIAIVLFYIFFSVVTSENESEKWEIDYNHYLDRITLTRIH